MAIRFLRSFLIVLSIIILMEQCCAQVTFSRNWEPSGGKRNGQTIFPIPELYFKLSANGICQYLLSEIKHLTPCDTRTEEGAPLFTPN